jgi:hypothetical protein
MTARRISLGGAVLAIATALTVWLVVHRSGTTSMVRVGGASNACACTHRIEP